MTITNFEPTSRWDIRPSGDTLDLVNPGMSRVVGRFRAGVDDPESCRRGKLQKSAFLMSGPHTCNRRVQQRRNEVCSHVRAVWSGCHRCICQSSAVRKTMPNST